ncbi:MAG: septum formation initiator family protein [Defluviicoccus sp.]|jgi:cell division protein FtsB|nr:septum formation initiator family protein [Defluviicoccus sp.]MDG4609038.1 septum formation initiator family protein [Defluviicoccus sp.]
MSFLYALKIRARHAIWPAVGVCGLGYMAYHIVQGDRGLLAWKVFREQIAIARASLAESEAERRALDEQVRLLDPDALDRDMLDEWARRRLNFGARDEIVILTEPTGPRETSARSSADAGATHR